ncbi:MocD [Nostocoides australiense Ben110]|uniref:MocD n=1 Tax=Nostocoides australiense Ben110 TaxID=1193182 RepID=W6K3T0_9MICO|nr:SIS domain-containing protein [Tetrasphaera australiensis]CCH73799.1 MocD [Tetrasphaera australiensis Ben110]
MTQVLDLKPIDADTEEKLSGAIAERDRIREVVAKAVEDGLTNIWFVGAGGSLICSYPAHYVLQQHASVPTFQLQSDELNCSIPKLMGKGSLVVLASYTGKTKETVEAAKTASGTGATVIAGAKEGSPLAEAVSIAFSGKSDLFELLVALAVLEATGADLPWDEIETGLAALPAAVKAAVEEADADLASIAEDFKDDPVTYVLGSGPSYGWAYGMAMCFLQEMQWKHAAGFNSGEFFQGAFEVIDNDSAVILWLGEDASRPMGERAQAFLKTYAARARTIDVAALELPGVPASVRPIVSPLVVGALANRLAQRYEHTRNHSLENRHYMFKVDY